MVAAAAAAAARRSRGGSMRWICVKRWSVRVKGTAARQSDDFNLKEAARAPKERTQCTNEENNEELIVNGQGGYSNKRGFRCHVASDSLHKEAVYIQLHSQKQSSLFKYASYSRIPHPLPVAFIAQYAVCSIPLKSYTQMCHRDVPSVKRRRILS